MGNFCKVANFILHLLICKFVTFVKRLKKAICRNILNMGLISLYNRGLRRERVKYIFLFLQCKSTDWFLDKLQRRIQNHN